MRYVGRWPFLPIAGGLGDAFLTPAGRHARVGWRGNG